MERIQIIVPCYNEGSRLDPDQFKHFAGSHADVKFLFVNDGSTDSTQAVLEQLCKELKQQGALLQLRDNCGKAEAVRLGLLQALQSDRPEFLGYWDGDLATPLDQLPAFVSILDSHSHISLVVGSRVKLLGRNITRRATRHYLGRVFATAASLVLNLPIYDTQCGAKLMRATDGAVPKALEQPFRSTWIFDVEFIARLNQLVPWESSDRHFIYEYPLTRWHDVAGSKVRPWHFVTAAIDLAKIYLRY